MSNIEKRFFDAFGILPKHNDGCRLSDLYYKNLTKMQTIITHDSWMKNNCPENNDVCFSTCEYAYDDDQYPEILSQHYLELICILNTVTEPDLGDINVGRLKMTILEECIKALDNVDWTNREPSKEDFINDVRSLFVEE